MQTPRVPNPHDIRIANWPFEWWVPSISRPGRWRKVNWRTRQCDCPAGLTKKLCRHVRWVDEYAKEVNFAVLERMTTGQAGWSVLRECEAWAKQSGIALDMEGAT